MTDTVISDEYSVSSLADDICDRPVSRRPTFPATRSLTSVRLARGAGRIPWPRVGGVGMPVQQTSIFASSAFRDAWRDSGESRAIYAGGCQAEGVLAKVLHHMVYKVSTTDPRQIWRRMQQLRTDQYGACWVENGTPVIDTEGWGSWFPSLLFPNTRAVSPGAPIEIGPRSIVVSLPDTMSAEDFDDAFDARVGAACLEDWALSEVGIGYCRLMGLDPARFRRYTAYEAGDTIRLSPARELTLFSIFEDTDRLIQIAEDILLEHYGLGTPQPSAG